PVVLLTGLWMYAGVIFAVIGVAVWLGSYQLFGPGPAILIQIALLIARKIWLMIRARQSKASGYQDTPDNAFHALDNLRSKFPRIEQREGFNVFAGTDETSGNFQFILNSDDDSAFATAVELGDNQSC